LGRVRALNACAMWMGRPFRRRRAGRLAGTPLGVRKSRLRQTGNAGGPGSGARHGGGRRRGCTGAGVASTHSGRSHRDRGRLGHLPRRGDRVVLGGVVELAVVVTEVGADTLVPVRTTGTSATAEPVTAGPRRNRGWNVTRVACRRRPGCRSQRIAGATHKRAAGAAGRAPLPEPPGIRSSRRQAPSKAREAMTVAPGVEEPEITAGRPRSPLASPKSS